MEGEALKWEPQAISVAHSLHPQSVKRKIQCQHQLLPADETGSSAFYFLARSPYKPLQKDRRQTDSSIYRPLPITNLGHAGSFVPSMKRSSLLVVNEPWYMGGIIKKKKKRRGQLIAHLHFRKEPLASVHINKYSPLSSSGRHRLHLIH